MKFSGIIYLDNDIIIEIHKLQLEEHGGLAGVRDQGGLESAIAQPKASFGEDDLHPTIFDKAAAYAFYIAEAQALVDGNRRTALTAALKASLELLQNVRQFSTILGRMSPNEYPSGPSTEVDATP